MRNTEITRLVTNHVKFLYKHWMISWKIKNQLRHKPFIMKKYMRLVYSLPIHVITTLYSVRVLSHDNYYFCNSRNTFWYSLCKIEKSYGNTESTIDFIFFWFRIFWFYSLWDWPISYYPYVVPFSLFFWINLGLQHFPFHW